METWIERKARRAKEKRDLILNKYNFSELAENESDPAVRRRMIVLSILKNGKNLKETSQELRISPKSIKRWIFKIEKLGLKGLHDQLTTGRRSKLKESEILRMHTEVTIFVKNFHEKNKRLYAKHLIRFIEKEFKIDYSHSTIYKMLRELGLEIIPNKVSH